MLLLILASLRPRPVTVRLQRAPCVTGCDGSPWTEEETWALVDSTPAFTAGQGKNAATFWTALVASNAVLCQRSPSECMEHAAQLAAVQNATQPFGPEPAVLEDWSRQPDGRISGTLRGRAVWLNVDLEARLEADPRPTASYVETVGGIVYELGRRVPSDDPTPGAGGAGAGAGDADADALRRWGVLQGAVAAPAAGTGTVLLSLLAAGVVGFFGGAEFGSYEYIELQPAQPPPAPLPARAAPPAQLPAARAYPAAERVSLTVSEQAARQQIRLDSDQLRLDNMRAQAQRMDDPAFYENRLDALKQRAQADQDRVGNFDERVKVDKQRVGSRIAEQELRVRIDRENLAELQRVASERGSDAAAVQVGVFPPSQAAP
mmetsp:Transcript_63040/g.152195  ORF Transcript_63040/g.152195 Transcript_63040/m.152195 type:complete len:376 (+) Transcript_63040:357-1484(+)